MRDVSVYSITNMPERGPEAFQSFYAGIYPDRWDSIQDAILNSPHPGVALETSAAKPYYLDPASMVAALAAGRSGNQAILDMCAAPGGKTLVLVSSLDPSGRITANERSATRRSRLHRVLNEHVPPTLRQQITVTSHDARRWSLHEKNAYDVILADVPCSSEAHLLAGKGDINTWSPRRSSRIAHDQYAILRAAIQAIRPGGRIVYSTCALSPAENETVVLKALKKGEPNAHLELLEPDTTAIEYAKKYSIMLEQRESGYHILPDTSHGIGPIYFCVLQKTSA